MCITPPTTVLPFAGDTKSSCCMHHTQPFTNITIVPKTTRIHKEYGEPFTTICTQCKRVLLPSLVNPSGISIRLTKEEDDQWINSDDLSVSQPISSCLSHGLCRSCFNNMDADLLTTTTSTTSTRIRSALSKSVSSPQLLRHMPSRPNRVLIVDDNRLQRQIHQRMVEQAGYDCDVAFGGAQALELVEKHTYSLILMDLVMSPLDGWTTAKKIRSSLLQTIGFNSSTRIVAVTGLRVDDSLKKECTDSGMDEVVQKPISPAQLNKVLNKHTSQRTIDR